MKKSGIYGCVSSINLGKSRLSVKDVMSSPPITIPENTNVDKTAQLMSGDRLVCIIVTSNDGKALGLITERDLVTPVLAKKLKLRKLTAKEVASTPLFKIFSYLKFTTTTIRTFCIMINKKFPTNHAFQH